MLIKSKHKRTGHHKIPRCRGGDRNNGNIVKLPQSIHVAWHTLFDNLTPCRSHDDDKNRNAR